MQTILERFKTLEEAGVPHDSVTEAHECEHSLARQFRAWFGHRKQAEADLRTLWTPAEVATAGLSAPRNPREVMVELVALAEHHLAPEMKNGKRLLQLIRELDCTFEPMLQLLPPSPDA